MFLYVDKPTWYTSFDIVKKIKKLYRGEKVWHAWTLDPLATWLLIIAVWKDTKKLQQYIWLDKKYTTTLDLSMLTDTRDSDYWKEKIEYACTDRWIVIDDKELPAPTRQQIEQLIAGMKGTHPFPLTPFSAKKIKGKKLYEYAREWNPIFIDIPMDVIDAEIVDYRFPLLTLHFHVWSWTYIRSLAHRIGKQFGIWWTVISLRRTAIGPYSLDE